MRQLNEREKELFNRVKNRDEAKNFTGKKYVMYQQIKNTILALVETGQGQVSMGFATYNPKTETAAFKEQTGKEIAFIRAISI